LKECQIIDSENEEDQTIDSNKKQKETESFAIFNEIM